MAAIDGNDAVELPAAAVPLRRRSDRRRAKPGHGERITTMLVMAGLFHGLVILGVRFTTDPPAAPAGIGMEVLLVSDELPESRDNPDARYLAQRTQSGSGNSDERLSARLPGAPERPPPSPTQATPQGDPADEVLGSPRGAITTDFRAETALPAPADQLAEPQVQAPLRIESETDLLLRGPRRDELYVSPDTRESDVAPYLAAWKRRVEKVGTINYPSAAQRRGLTGNPVLEVLIAADGTLREARIQRSSGHAEIDAAALDILRLASPFEPFPVELSAKHDILRFAYEWQFEGGRVRSSLTVP